jgi:hypothetical protein
MFKAMEDLSTGKIDVNQAKQIANLGQVVVNSAVAETKHLRDHGGQGTGFIQEEKPVLKITGREQTLSEHEKTMKKYL